MKIDLLGLKINTETKAELLAKLKDRIHSGQKTFITTPYSEFFYYAFTDYKFKQIVNNADFSIPDGVIVLWLPYFFSIPFKSKSYYPKVFEGFFQIMYYGWDIIFRPEKTKQFIPEKIPGSDFFWDLIELANKERQRVFLLGGFEDTPQKVKEKVLEKYPDIEVPGFSNLGPGHENVIDLINNSKSDILFVAYGPVKQEKWIAENFEKLNVKTAIGVGGTFDYVAGKRKQPPRMVRDMGLETFYRLFTQPYRVKRIWNATFRLLRGALREKVFMSMPFRNNVVGVIINKDKKIFVGKRVWAGFDKQHESHFQFPQGGVEEDENPDFAILREMEEEIGTRSLEILGKNSKQYEYLWPHPIRPLWFNKLKFKGQRQTIYYLKYSGENDINLKTEHQEFDKYLWVEPGKLKEVIHPLRHQMLDMALEDLNKYL